MPLGSSDLVRSVVVENYVLPAIATGKTRFPVAVREVMTDLRSIGFPASNYPQVCTAMQTGKFLREQGLEIERVDGPPSGLSTTVVVHYKLVARDLPTQPAEAEKRIAAIADASAPPVETKAARAMRALESLRGLLKEELAEYGGGEAFIRWIRSDGEEDETPEPTR